MFNPSLPRENADAQTVSTDGTTMIYVNGQAHMFERKIVIKKQGGVLNRKKTKPSNFFFSYLNRYSNTYTFLQRERERERERERGRKKERKRNPLQTKKIGGFFEDPT
jgi:hypothetical protein